MLRSVQHPLSDLEVLHIPDTLSLGGSHGKNQNALRLIVQRRNSVILFSGLESLGCHRFDWVDVFQTQETRPRRSLGRRPLRLVSQLNQSVENIR